MPQEKSPGKPTTRRCREDEKAQAVRLVRQARDEGREHGAVQRVANQLGFGAGGAPSTHGPSRMTEPASGIVWCGKRPAGGWWSYTLSPCP